MDDRLLIALAFLLFVALLWAHARQTARRRARGTPDEPEASQPERPPTTHLDPNHMPPIGSKEWHDWVALYGTPEDRAGLSEAWGLREDRQQR